LKSRFAADARAVSLAGKRAVFNGWMKQRDLYPNIYPPTSAVSWASRHGVVCCVSLQCGMY
jgi:hypothetical protein